MNVTERARGSIMILDIAGTITLGESADTLRDKVRSLLQQGNKRIIVNLADVSYMDSAGLGELVRAHATAAQQGAGLKLTNVTKRLQDLLVITKLATVFDSYDSETAAVASFGAAV
jgi:anti-sigma B factor antagonist